MSSDSSAPLFPSRLLPLAIIVSVLASSAPVVGWAQATSVEELERRLQKAKEEKARRDSAAAKAREDSEVERKRREADAARAESERKAQEARMATVVVQADAPCALTMNGDAIGVIQPGISKHRVSPGQKLVSCASSEEKTSFQGEVEARSGQDTVLRIALAAKVGEIQSIRAATLEREAQTRRETEAREKALADQREIDRIASERLRQEQARRAAIDADPQSYMVSRMSLQADNSVLDRELRLYWTRADTSIDVNWHQASDHCRTLGAGWVLPTAAQLQSLFHSNLKDQACGGHSCRIAPQFQVSQPWVWANEATSRLQASIVDLRTGKGSTNPPDARTYNRVLCIRPA
jgi:hypothetical protein